jgi:broad specificity phosphatase PhoE
VRIFVLARHGESELNIENRVNGDPAVCVDLTEEGEEQARALAYQVAHLPLDVCLHTRFGRTRRTAEIVVSGRGVPLVEEPLFDDIDIGDLEGKTIQDYRAWKRVHTRADRFPSGESLDEAARRYAAGIRRLLECDYRTALVICHEIPVRYALNAAAGSDSVDGPMHDIKNATPYIFDDEALDGAWRRLEELSRAAAPTA